MDFDVTVCIATNGDARWIHLAQERAVPSVHALDVPVIHWHGKDDLAGARNAALDCVETEWVIYLDADDELEPGYVEAMAAGTADVRGPIARYVQNVGQPNERWNFWQPRVYGHTHDCEADCLKAGNWLIIGSAVRANMLRDIGGWKDFAWSEDWSTWLRCYKAGASFELIRDAIYRAHVDPQGRNRRASRELIDSTHRAIYADAYPEEAAAA